MPTPAVKFRMVAGAQIDVTVAPDQPQKIPNLLLPAIRTAPFAAYPVARYVVTQPVARTADDFDVLQYVSDSDNTEIEVLNSLRDENTLFFNVWTDYSMQW